MIGFGGEKPEDKQLDEEIKQQLSLKSLYLASSLSKFQQEKILHQSKTIEMMGSQILANVQSEEEQNLALGDAIWCQKILHILQNK